MDNSNFQEIVLKRFELLDLIAVQVGKLTAQMDGLTARVDTLTQDMTEVKADLAALKEDLQFTKNVVIRIENEHGQKLGALMNGYKQNAERLDRHEAIISKKY